jgi:hypothetical protein
MKCFVRENGSMMAVILLVTFVVVALTGGSVAATYVTPIACFAVVLWREKRKEAV